MEKTGWKWAFAFALAVLLVYGWTLYPSVPGGDSGELITAACTLSVAHPPGYPLYTLLGKGFTYLPFGTIAWRVNLLSAFCDAGAAFLIFLSLRRLTGRWAPGFLASGLFAFSPIVWSYATAAEVFALNHLLLSALAYLSIRWRETREPRALAWGSLVFGLGLSNHPLFLLTAFPLWGWMLFQVRKEEWSLRRAAVLAGAVALGMTPYLYLPLAGLSQSMTSWGDTATFRGFWIHVLRSEYGTFQLAVFGEGSTLTQALLRFLRFAWNQLLGVGLGLVLAGAVWLLRKSRWGALAGILAASGVVYLVLFHALSNLPLENPLYYSVQARFWQQPIWILAILAGAALAWVPEKAAFALAGVLVLVQLGLHFRAHDQRRNETVAEFGRAILRSLPENALYLPLGDLDLHSVRYFQYCEGMRPDVKTIPRALLGYPWMAEKARRAFPDVAFPAPGYLRFYRDRSEGFGLREFLEANASRFPIFLSGRSAREEEDWKSRFETLPVGLVEKVVPAPLNLDAAGFGRYLSETEGAHRHFDWKRLETGTELAWENYAADRYWDSEYRKALVFLSWGERSPENLLGLRAARDVFERSIERMASPPFYFHKALGATYALLVGREPEAERRAIEAWRIYLERSPRNDPDREEIARKLAERKNP